LHAGDLVVEQFHRIDNAAAVLIVLRVRTKHAAQQDSCTRSKSMNGMRVNVSSERRGDSHSTPSYIIGLMTPVNRLPRHSNSLSHYALQRDAASKSA
jgi:hypothetical protein